MERLAVVLFNLGGPDGPRAIEPFLFNLFNDAAIIQAPNPLRWMLAKFLSRKRAPEAREIFKKLGGKSPLLEETQAQADALTRRLEDRTGEVRVFIAMRYWHPMSEETVQAVKAFGPDEIILLPLYPQYSTTTTASSLKEWHAQAIAQGLDRPTRAICCYPTDPGLIRGQAALIGPSFAGAKSHGRPRILFSAHGLPKKIIARGDPYQWQIEQTARTIVDALGISDLDWAVCYQSRVGPLQWIGPSIDEEILRAAGDRVPVVVVPVAFVSEHSETLVELDIQYRDLAHERGVPHYVRVSSLGVQEDFIGGLAGAVETALASEKTLCPSEGTRLCPAGYGKCPITGP
ncbi:MAG: ferrochelatase [Proteobacteria bacterium]|nr:ferrochelatase [Pseudomonadota bacterium]